MGGFVGGIFGGGGPSQPNVQVYQPSGTPTVDSQLQGLLSQNTNLSGAGSPYNTYSPQFAQLYNSVYSSPYAGAYQTGAGTAGAQYGQVGTQALNNSTALSSAINPALTAAGTALSTAFDPQSALYAQTLQKTNDQANVANAQYGLTGQQAAGNVQQADTNFNIDWQNNELQRQLSGLTGYNQTLTGTGAAAGTAQSTGAAGAGNTLTGAATPYGTGVSIAGQQQTALQDYIASLLGPSTSSQQTVGNLQNYLNTGVNASAQGANAALGDYNAALTNSANLGSGIGDILGLQTGSSGNTIGGSLFSSLKSAGSSAASLLSTVLCTAFYKRGMVSREVWVATRRYGQAANPDTFAGYLLWATPIARKVARDLWFAKLMAPIFIPPLLCEAKVMGCKNVKTSLYGVIAFKLLHGLFWATGRVLKKTRIEVEA